MTLTTIVVKLPIAILQVSLIAEWTGFIKEYKPYNKK